MEEWRWEELLVNQEVAGASADTHVHELHVGFGARSLIKDLDGHRDLHRLALRDPDALKNNNNKKVRVDLDTPLSVALRQSASLLPWRSTRPA